MQSKGRPKGTTYDYLIHSIANLMVDGQKTFNQSFREVLNKHSTGVEDETARRHLLKLWKTDEQKLLSMARARTEKRALEKLKATPEYWLAKEAFFLTSLVRRPISPIDATMISSMSLTRERSPANDYNRNPFARTLMNFQEFQQAQLIRDGVLYG